MQPWDDKGKYRKLPPHPRPLVSDELPSGKSSEAGPKEKWTLATVGVTAVAGATVIPYFSSVETVPALVTAAFRLGFFVVGVYGCVRGVRAWQGGARTLIWGLLLLLGSILVLLSVFGHRIDWPWDGSGPGGENPVPTATNARPPTTENTAPPTFRALWQPALDRQSITDGDVARSVDGMELEARNCGDSSAKSYRLTGLEAGTRLAFDVQIVGRGEAQGAYLMHLHGAEVDESFNVDGDDAEHVRVETGEAGDVIIDISALRSTDGTCRDSREFLAVQNGTID